MNADQEGTGGDLEPGLEPDPRDETTAGAPEADRLSAGWVPADVVRSRPVVLAAVAAGVAAAAVIGAKIAYDRHRSAKGYRRAVHQLEDAKETLLAAAAELPARSRATLHRVTRR